MVLALKAWRLRESARGALASGDAEEAAHCAAEAQGVQRTETGEALRVLSAWLSVPSITEAGKE
jgi:hypothetical protein